jgi:nondiscriminating glutamyl-tRNA synthetase
MMEEDFKFIKPGEVRTRFAPSPTGFLHIGGARTALFNYLFAKKYEGIFVLRIEDTDIERSKKEYEKDLIENMKWLAIEWDEGPIADGQNQKYIGNYGPYRQSERLHIYKKYLEKLLKEGKAYYCFCSEEELEAQRQYQMSIGEAPHYNGKCAKFKKEEVEKLLSEGKKAIIRFKTPAKKVVFEDIIRGSVEFDTALLGDIVIARDLTSPLYNFSVVIDDFEMKISHVIRGEEHLSNTPKQILFQEALGFPPLKYAHLPLILGPDRSKLSKRHGAMSIKQYREEGYLPEALINFMAFLGWNPGIEREIYSLNSLIKDFELPKVQKAGAVFNIKRLDFLNGFYIRQRSIEKLTELCLPYLIEGGLITQEFETKQYPPAYGAKEITPSYKITETKEKISFDYLKKTILIYKERMTKISEIPDLVNFFFKKEIKYDKKLLEWKDATNKEINASLEELEKLLSKIKNGDWNKENLEKILIPEAEKFASELSRVGSPASLREALRAGDKGYLLWPLRVALSGKKASAGPFDIAEILGKEKTLKRIIRAHNILCARPSI